jgi:secondary thiamine-phosphate synthase enzyme
MSRGFHLVTSEILRALPPLEGDGVLNIFIQHTSAGLTINENADPDVRADYELLFNRIVAENQPGLLHTIEGPDDMPAHIKSTLTGHSLSIPFANGQLMLGTWQGIYLCEFRNRATGRKIVATVMT